jgi:hypothetical protein
MKEDMTKYIQEIAHDLKLDMDKSVAYRGGGVVCVVQTPLKYQITAVPRTPD